MLKNDRFVAGFEGISEGFERLFVDSMHSILVRLIGALSVMVIVGRRRLMPRSVLSPISRAL